MPGPGSVGAKQKGRGCPRPFWEYSVARPSQPRLVSPRPPLGSYAEILSIVVVICDIHKLSDELHPEGDQRAYLTQHLNDPYSPTSILIRPHRTSPELQRRFGLMVRRPCPAHHEVFWWRRGALQPPSAKSYMIAFSNGPRAILQR